MNSCFKRVLVANRGDAALRVMRTLYEMDIHSVLACSAEDYIEEHPLAERTICIGDGAARDIYMNSYKILNAAYSCEAEAVHPGYGFLSEDPVFSKLCEEMGFKFIGAGPETLERISNKPWACGRAGFIGIPNLFLGNVKEKEDVSKGFEECGDAIVLKPSFGGGGKGIRVIKSSSDVGRAWKEATIESPSRMSGAGFYIERFIDKAKHIEAQIIRDSYGNITCFPLRECSVQKRNQKWIEETPALEDKPDLKEKIIHDARRLIEEVELTGLATVEFLVRGEEYYFCEVNARLQVEHTISELITGYDIVRAQVEVAAGKIFNESLKKQGHAIEARIYSGAGNATSSSQIRLPGGLGIRIDESQINSSINNTTADPLMAKICSHGKGRQDAIRRLKRALSETDIAATQTNIESLIKVLNNRDFLSGNYDLRILSRANGDE